MLLLSCLIACTTWEVQEASPQQLLASEQPPDRLLVTLSDNSWVILKEPRMSGDSLIGVVYDGRYHGQRLEGGLTTGIRLHEVVRVEVASREEHPLLWFFLGASGAAHPWWEGPLLLFLWPPE